MRHAAPVALAFAVVVGAGAPGPASCQDTLASPAGRLLERITARADSTQAYALFLPRGYTTAGRWPVMFILDPRGRALLPLRRLRAAANERGFVLLSSYNSMSDGPIEPNIAAMNAMLAEAERGVSMDQRRLYVVGFSGTARAAWMFARALGDRVPGIIGAGAGIDRSFFGDDSARRPVAFFGAIGRRDFNHDEMRVLDALLDTLGFPHRVSYFAGRHEWPPDSVLATGVEWLDLQAIRRGLRPYDSVWVEQLATRWLSEARTRESNGPPLEALEAYRAVAADFPGTAQGRVAAERATALADRPDVRLAVGERTRLADASARYRALLDLTIGAVNSRQARPSLAELRRVLKIDSLKAEAARNPGDASDAAQRLLEFTFVITSFYQWRYYVALRDHERALLMLEVAALIDPQSPRICLHRSYAWALAGRRAEAIRDLECARRAGVLTEAVLADRAFDRIRNSAEFRALSATDGGRRN